MRHGQGLDDDYEDAATCEALRLTDEKDDWSKIAVADLNQCYSSLSFFDAEGMRFHLGRCGKELDVSVAVEKVHSVRMG